MISNPNPPTSAELPHEGKERQEDFVLGIAKRQRLSTTNTRQGQVHDRSSSGRAEPTTDGFLRKGPSSSGRKKDKSGNFDKTANLTTD